MKPYYEEAGIAIYLGDCRDVLPSLGDVALTVTSPPYNLVREWSGGGVNSIHPELHLRQSGDRWYPDVIEESEYQQQQRAVVSLCLKLSSAVCYNHKIRYAMKRRGCSYHPMQWLLEFPLWAEIIWNRGGGIAFNAGRPTPVDERIFVLGHPRTFNNLHLTSVWRIRPEAEAGEFHPCPFPIEIPSRCIAIFSGPEDVILDPFMGSGTTLRAAKDLGRRAIGIEIEEKYCEIAALRLQQGVLQFEQKDHGRDDSVAALPFAPSSLRK